MIMKQRSKKWCLDLLANWGDSPKISEEELIPLCKQVDRKNNLPEISTVGYKIVVSRMGVQREGTYYVIIDKENMKKDLKKSLLVSEEVEILKKAKELWISNRAKKIGKTLDDAMLCSMRKFYFPYKHSCRLSYALLKLARESENGEVVVRRESLQEAWNSWCGVKRSPICRKSLESILGSLKKIGIEFTVFPVKTPGLRKLNWGFKFTGGDIENHLKLIKSIYYRHYSQTDNLDDYVIEVEGCKEEVKEDKTPPTPTVAPPAPKRSSIEEYPFKLFKIREDGKAIQIGQFKENSLKEFLNPNTEVIRVKRTSLIIVEP